MRLFICKLLIILCCPVLLLAQGSAGINTANLDQTLIHTLFLKHLNHHRDSLKLPVLKIETHLNNAAQCQAQYIASINTLTHEQTTPTKATVLKRVTLFEGNFSTVGENVLYLPLGTTFTIKDKTHQLNSFNDLAWAMFMSWKNSPGHYKNMITPTFINSGFSITYNSKTKLLYAAQVFGGKAYVAPYKFPRVNDIGAIAYDNTHKYDALAKETFSISLANFTYETGAQTRFYHYDLNEVKSFITDKNDGLMVDYVVRQQFNCDAEHNLNNAAVYDGWPQPPLYSAKMYSQNNRVENKELDVVLNSVPKELEFENYQSNLILIKNNLAINYAIPLTVESANFNLLSFEPLIDTVSYALIDTTLQFNFSEKIYFEKGTSVPINQAQIMKSVIYFYTKNDDKLIYNNFSIIGFSSVEGDSSINNKLQQQRVEYIQKLYTDSGAYPKLKIRTAVSINTTDFVKDYKLIMKPVDTLTTQSVLTFYKNNSHLIKETDLATHRYAQVNYTLSYKLNKNISNEQLKHLYENIDKMDDRSKLLLLKIALLKLHTNDSAIALNAQDFTSINSTDILMPFYYYVSDSTKLRALYETNKNKKNWTSKDTYNFVIANFKYYDTYNRLFISLNDLYSYINQLNSTVVSIETNKLVCLNYYLISVQHNNAIKNKGEVTKAMEKFKSIYMSFNPNVSNNIKIGLFFNHFNYFSWTLELLKPKLEQALNNERLWFTYLSTYAFAKYPNYEEAFTKNLINNCIKLNQAKFCTWINKENFQLLRNPIFKENYCKTCAQ